METSINILVISFGFLIIFIIEKILFKKGPTKERIAAYQKKLNEDNSDIEKNIKDSSRINIREEIIKEDRQEKIFFYFVFSILVVFAFVIFSVVYNFSKLNISLICFLGLVFLFNGIIKLIKTKKHGIQVLIIYSLTAVVFEILFFKILVLFPYVYFYLTFAVIIFGLFVIMFKILKYISRII